ncbi:uncharacterized protein LOC117076122 [Trachypithecus francoisi]|uniref:uncharacterized protein LOC117076122 n=1 Tax=Trachypithecus francoisi TaxID=54180 RepID=UPI00141A792D|nr:uncharacterized protein LOC117076122 [Trachypithecus francoisi]
MLRLSGGPLYTLVASVFPVLGGISSECYETAKMAACPFLWKLHPRAVLSCCQHEHTPCFGAVGNFSILIHLFGSVSCEKWMRPTSANLYESFQDAYKWKLHSSQPNQALPDSLQLCAVK